MGTSTGNEDYNRQERLNRIKELENVVEKHTRTERHLEQYSRIGSEDAIDSARDKQRKREEEMETLESKIIYDDGGPTDEKRNLEKRYTYAEGYMKHNADHMNPSDLDNLQDKQENRRDTLDTLRK